MKVHTRYEPCQIKLEMERLRLTSQLRRQTNVTEAHEIDWNEQREIRTQLDLIAHAQQRIDDGSYGTCLECNCPIDPERLLILPSTEYCQTCSARMASFRNKHLQQSSKPAHAYAGRWK